jgi:hypothetical protein
MWSCWMMANGGVIQGTGAAAPEAGGGSWG